MVDPLLLASDDLDREQIASKIRENFRTILSATNATPFKVNFSNYQCYFCVRQRFSNMTHMRAHYMEKHFSNLSDVIPKIALKWCFYDIKLDITDLHCTYCLKSYHGLDDVTQHLIMDHDVKYNHEYHQNFYAFKLTNDMMLPCMECNETFVFIKKLIEHTQKQHPRGDYMCSDCGYRLISDELLQRHIIKCTKILNIGDGAKNESQVKTRKIDREFKCVICGEAFSSKVKRKRHTIIDHNLGSMFKCDICPEEFVYKSQVLIHKDSSHLKECECPYCGKRLDQMYMKKHMIIHSDQKDFICGICDKAFRRRCNMIRHMFDIHKI